MMEWVQGFLGKHKRLAVFDEIWSSLQPYSGFTPPKKQYRQITMWSGTEMREVGRVILACFTAAMRREKDSSCLSPAAQSDLKVAIRAIRALSDFCLIAQYQSHTPETIKYMSQYLQAFHKYRHVLGEFRASKADHKRAKGASKDLAVGIYSHVHGTRDRSQDMLVDEWRQLGYETECLNRGNWESSVWK